LSILKSNILVVVPWLSNRPSRQPIRRSPANTLPRTNGLSGCMRFFIFSRSFSVP
jgi:hypothetical protein